MVVLFYICYLIYFGVIIKVYDSIRWYLLCVRKITEKTT